MVFTSPPSLPKLPYSTSLLSWLARSTRYPCPVAEDSTDPPPVSDPPEDTSLPDFMYNEEYRIHKSDKANSFVCGLTGKAVSANEAKDRVESIASGLSKRLGWSPQQEETEWEKIACIYSINAVSVWYLLFPEAHLAEERNSGRLHLGGSRSATPERYRNPCQRGLQSTGTGVPAQGDQCHRAVHVRRPVARDRSQGSQDRQLAARAHLSCRHPAHWLQAGRGFRQRRTAHRGRATTSALAQAAMAAGPGRATGCLHLLFQRDFGASGEYL